MDKLHPTVEQNHGAFARTAGDALLLRPRDAARYLAISPRKLWELSNTGEIPSLRIGRCLRYSCDELRAWVAGRKSRRS
jgi:excisionase family DNA binding protein